MSSHEGVDPAPESKVFPFSEVELERAFNFLEKNQENRSSQPQTNKGANSSNQRVDEEERAKTSLRIQYEAEAQVIRRKLGSLEEVRRSLGLTRRKMCQLLMVDPSAWTRWMRDESKVPPHVYRSLQWYLALIDKQPEWHPKNAFLGAFKAAPPPTKEQMDLFRQFDRLKRAEEDSQRYFEDRLAQLRLELTSLVEKLQEREGIQIGWKLLLVLNLLLSVYVAFLR